MWKRALVTLAVLVFATQPSGAIDLKKTKIQQLQLEIDALKAGSRRKAGDYLLAKAI